MKKTKLTRSLLAAVSVVALSAVMYGCVHNGGSDDPEPVVEPMPDPEPPAPTDLEDTQAAAAAAATAAGEAATAAADAAKAAADATANIATLQTNGTAAALAADARKYASAAMKAADDAEAASADAAAAETGPDAEAAWRMAENAKDVAAAAAMTAGEKAEAAEAAAMMELHIDGAMHMVGGSSVDAATGTLISQPANRVTTGYIGPVSRAADAIAGVAFDQRGTSAEAFTADGISIADDETTNATDVAYVQAVAAGSADIGKVLDTSDDMARLTIITAREGKRSVRVFADRAADNTADGLLATGLLADLDATEDGTQGASVKSIGDFYMAANTADTDNNALDEMDEVDPASDPVELFELTGTVDVGGTPTEITRYARVIETRTDGTGEVTGRTYRAVDITAVAGPDVIGDTDDNPEQVQVRASLPTADDYDHIHFGVWAGLMDNEDGDNSVIANLGIGFVQNYDKSGVTTGHVTGTATYSGDWVAVVRQMHSEKMSVEDGHASMTANFSTDEFTAALDDLAMLEGSLSGNTFSGTTATVSHVDMDASGTFLGSFSGAVYGPDGAEAAGVFSFDGGDAGAFVGAFGGRDDDQ